ncbi:MAG: ferredoxin--NADP reductase [Pirellulaceae bacterium]|nr:ferredoxin--NADP reductase [Pirellulaceae bacterium]
MKWTPATVERMHVWDEGLFTLAVRAPAVEPFKPGQFLQLGFDLPDGHLHRPYSVASPHGDVLEFFIVMVEGGQLTPRLWNLKVGDVLDVSQKAAGSFTLEHCPDASSLWLIGTGTGLAPYIAMLRTQQPWERYQRIVIVHGVRHVRDLAYQAEMAEYTQRNAGRFCYLPVVSREAYSHGLSGRITTCIENGSLERAADLEFSQDNAIMLCGNPDMLDDCEQLLAARNIVKHKKKAPGQIVIERYW